MHGSRGGARPYLGVVDLGSLLAALAPFLGFLLIAAAAFAFAVWFGLRKVAPRIDSALDRAETKDDIDP